MTLCGAEMGRPFNHYTCQKCKRVTIAKHEDDGVTPMFLTCRATPGCMGCATSSMYLGSQDPAQVPHVIWFRPATRAEAVAWINANVLKRYRQGTIEHWEKGGALLREMTGGPGGLQ